MHKILRDLVVIKDTATSLKDAVARVKREEEVRTVVASATRLHVLQRDFDSLRRTTLSDYDPSVFVIGKEM